MAGWVRRRGKGKLLMVEYHKSSPALAPPAQWSVTALNEKRQCPVAKATRRAGMGALRLQWLAREGDIPGDDLWYPTIRRPVYPLAAQRAKKPHASQHKVFVLPLDNTTAIRISISTSAVPQSRHSRIPKIRPAQSLRAQRNN